MVTIALATDLDEESIATWIVQPMRAKSAVGHFKAVLPNFMMKMNRSEDGASMS
jgi:hypothetical protein